MKRRDFLRSAAAFSLPAFAPSSVFASADQPGANDRVRVGLAGLGGRARWILLNEDLPGARILAVADCFQPRCDQMEDLGAIFRGEKGNIEILRGHARANPPELLRNAPPNTPGGPKESIPHIANFIECVGSRRKPAADAETGHRATTVCHLINICRRLGRKLQWDPKAEKFVNDQEANKLISRPRREGYELPAVA